MTVTGFFVYLGISAVIALIVTRIVPGRIPGGFVAATVVGVIGGFISYKLGPSQPTLGGIAFLPAAMGSLVMIIGLAWLGTSQKGFGKKV